MCSCSSIQVLLLVVFLVVCAAGQPQRNNAAGQHQRNKHKNIFRRQIEEPSSERYSYFDLELFEAIARNRKNENVAVSPISIKMILGMLMEGAKDETAEEIRRALRMPVDKDSRRLIFRSWLQPFVDVVKVHNKNVELELASELFLPFGKSVVANYTRTIQKYFAGNVTNLDFTNTAEAAQQINDWVDIATRGVITQLITPEQLSDTTNALLVNAVYFKASWKKPFDPKSTSNRCFRQDPNKSIKPPNKCFVGSFMRSTDTVKYAYVSGLDSQVIELPYKDERFSMIIMLPRGSIDELERDLLHEQLHNVLGRLKPKEVEMHIPRFTIDFEQDLSNVLQHLRISEVFGPNADLSGILEAKDKTMSVGNVLHSVKILVDEKGSEAAAATGVAIVPLIGEQKTTFVADHPFIFFIRDSKSKSILFAGRVYTPDEAIPKADKRQPEDPSYANMFRPTNNVKPSERPYVLSKPGPPQKVEHIHKPQQGAHTDKIVGDKPPIPLSSAEYKPESHNIKNNIFPNKKNPSMPFKEQEESFNRRPDTWSGSVAFNSNPGEAETRRTTPRPSVESTNKGNMTPPPPMRRGKKEVPTESVRRDDSHFSQIMFSRHFNN